MFAPATQVFRNSFLGSILMLALLSLGCREELQHIRSTVSEVKAEMEQQKAVVLQGAGATSAEPLFQRVFAEFRAEHPEAKLRYDGVGTGAGVRLFSDGKVDFGVGDQPLPESLVSEAIAGVRMFPLTAWGLAVVYNVKDASGNPIVDLKLSREAYSGIFRGTITRWNDPRIAQHNPGVTLPDHAIQVEYRLDDSGSTALLTNHLARIMPEWASSVGVGSRIDWPVGAGVPTNGGLLRAIAQTDNSIGYAGYATAEQAKMAIASLENASGKFVRPSLASIKAMVEATLAAGAEAPQMVDPAVEGVYPLVSYSYAYCHATYDQEAKLVVVQDLMRYCLGSGQKMFASMGQLPLPESVRLKALEQVETIRLTMDVDLENIRGAARKSLETTSR